MGNQSSSLHAAAAHNDVAKVESLITYQNANVNDRDKDDWTPLHFAAYGGALEVTQALLIRGANPEPADKAGRTPLHLAALQGHTTLASLLIGRGANVDAKDENAMTPLHKAAIKGNEEVGEQLLRLGARIDAEVKDGTRAIHLAAWKGHANFVRLLMSRGANIRAVTHSGRTPLHEAAESGVPEVVQLLLQAGANPVAQDKEGQVPASLATHAGHKDIAELIARLGGGMAPQVSRSGPSAPPLPGGTSSGRIPYPEIFQGGTNPPPQSEAAAEAKRNKDFWGDNLGEQDKEKTKNQNFWGSALGGSAPMPTPPPRDSPAEESARNKAFWDKKLAGGIPTISQRAHDWDARVGKAEAAWNAQIQQDSDAGLIRPADKKQAEGQQNPRQQFEQNLLHQAQGLWSMLQGKGGGQNREAQERREAERRRQEAQNIDAEWGGAPAAPRAQDWGEKPKVPTQELYNLKPYDDDDYEEEQPVKEPPQRSAQDVAIARRRLGQLELDLDREQGWVRGGSKADAEAAQARQKRIKEQEAEIAQLKRQLAGNKVTFGGRTGGRDLYSAVPEEYLCPITQEIMHDPVIAGDGYTYERGPIQKWLESGHNTSPMTGGKMSKQELTPNHALKSAIKQWQNR